MADPQHPSTPLDAEEMAYHRRTYRWFVRGTLLFALHALVILAVLGWVFSGDMG